MPDRIEGVVVVLSFSGDSIGLDAVRICIEHVGMASIVKGVEGEADDVIAGDCLTAADVRSDIRRVFLADEYSVEISIVVREINRSGPARRRSIMRLALPKFRDCSGIGWKSAGREIGD